MACQSFADDDVMLDEVGVRWVEAFFLYGRSGRGVLVDAGPCSYECGHRGVEAGGGAFYFVAWP